MKLNLNIILLFSVVYLFFLIPYTILDNEFIKYINYAMAAVLLVACAFYILVTFEIIPTNIKFYLYFFIISIAVNLLLHLNTFTFNYIKFFSMPIMFAVGYVFSIINFGNNRTNKKLIYLLLLVPLVFHLTAQVFWGGYLDQSMFANRNNAASYAIVSSILIVMFFERKSYVFLYLLPNIVVYKTLGALFALIIGSTIVFYKKLTPRSIFNKSHNDSNWWKAFIENIKKNRIIYGALSTGMGAFEILLKYLIKNRIGLVIIITAVAAFIFFVSFGDIEIFDRFATALRGLQVLAFDYSLKVEQVTYGRMVQILDSKDMSFLFRLKHWWDIIVIFFNSDPLQMIFGHGLGAIKAQSPFHKQAHNDYLFMLYNFGALYFIVFVKFHIGLIKKIGMNIFTFPLICFLIYMISENLIDNFIIISLLYVLTGIMYGNVISGKNPAEQLVLKK